MAENIERLMTQMKSKIAKAPRALAAIEGEIQDILTRMRTLKQAGLIYARTHVRSGRYTLLIYPMKDGVRPTPTYIGTDAAKIKAAEEAIARAEEYEELAEKLEKYRVRLALALDAWRQVEQALGYR